MTLRKSKCRRCDKQHFTMNPGTYCLQCQKMVKKQVKYLANDRHGRTGRNTFKKHKEFLNPMKREWLERMVIQ